MRRVIQLAVVGDTLFALCNDGAMFRRDWTGPEWNPVREIPQPAVVKASESDRICHALGGVCCEADEE